jgi:MoxR-like ATPase
MASSSRPRPSLDPSNHQNALRQRAKISQSPTRPEAGSSALDEKLRQAYFWIVNYAIISPYYDIAYHDEAPRRYHIGQSEITLPSAQSYASFVLLPLLNFAVRRKCLLTGGPGRGKTASAVLMGVLAGYDVKDVRRSVQQGQPQMTIMDLLGNPLPADLVQATDMDQIKIAWRKWLGMRVKIIDEYNRIPTRTQSALLTLMGDNYAEVLDQIYECPESAWYLTANADEQGGTYAVIEALKDRIDIVVRTLHFSPRFLEDLIFRMENQLKPEDIVPEEIIFTAEETDQMYHEILNVNLPVPLRRRIEHFASQFEFCEGAAQQFEYKTKDTLRLSQQRLVNTTETLGAQTQNGLSVRALLTLILFCKALAYFRGHSEVSLEDIRQILPFVLHDKLHPNPQANFFAASENRVYLSDRISWLRMLFDRSCEEYMGLALDENDPLQTLSEDFEQGLQDVDAATVRQRLQSIENLFHEFSQHTEESIRPSLYDDLIKLKYFHQRYTNYLSWLEWRNDQASSPASDR